MPVSGLSEYERMYAESQTLRRKLVAAERERDTAVSALVEAREALRLVEAWIRRGEGSESEATEAMDAALAARPGEQP